MDDGDDEFTKEVVPEMEDSEANGDTQMSSDAGTEVKRAYQW